MRNRVRKYVAFVLSLIFIWGAVSHVQIVQAESEVLATIVISTGGNSDLYLEGVSVKNFKATETGGCTGSFSLTSEQIEAVDEDERYLLYWYATNDYTDVIAQGNSPTIDVGLLNPGEIVYEEIVNNDGSVTYDMVTIRVYAKYGGAHGVTYISNETMGIDPSGNTSETIYYYQQNPDASVKETYNHPKTPTINGTLITNDGKFFKGWGRTDSGGVNAPSEFSYTDTDLRLFAQWQEPAKLYVSYYLTEDATEELSVDEITQTAETQTTLSFQTAAAPQRDGYSFLGWVYQDDSGANQTIAANTTKEIPIPDDGRDVFLDLYGTWEEAASAGTEIGAGTVALQANTAYKLASGSWSVKYNGSGDSCTYTGGNTFYVSTTGSYTFTAK